MATLKEIASEVGVSIATVSLYLNDKDTKRISLNTKAKIQSVIEELNYYPNSTARDLKTRRTRSIAVIMPFQGAYLRSDFVTEVVTGVQSVLFSNEYAMAFLPAQSNKLSEVIEHIIHNYNNYDGFIIIGSRFSTADDINAVASYLKNANIRFVIINMKKLDIDVNQVTIDQSSLLIPIKYLEDMGHTDILILHGVPESSDTIYVQDSLAKKSKRFPVIYGAYERDIAKTALLKYLDTHGKNFTAIYSLTDTMALGVYDALKERGYKIPDDISVVGRNDSYFATLIEPRLTTLRRNSFVEGEKAANILLTSLDNSTPYNSVVPGELIIRDSVRSLISKK